ncbi:MAG: transposase family protein [Candidatus Sungbacteria bacterium]|uniref:Transposase family protein n=1 Tax=Candidatus Sungiibacteriota bacterium TaxID=2750080 RepID=A0A9D6LSL8_9BACT|nr:transposase family protein [Candidatus Sungbacteria bacterium]
MDSAQIVSIEQIKRFTEGVEAVEFCGTSRPEKYAWVEATLIRFRYARCRKKDRSAVKEFIKKTTGYSDIQTKRLIGQYLKCGKVLLSAKKKHRFALVYTTDDVALLAASDNAHERLSGPAMKRIFERECDVFKKPEYERLAHISVSHLYNLRGRRQYVSHATTYTKTRSVSVPIGERRKPHPEGCPGFVRVDSVHQGDRDKEKGVYHINLVDEVLQWEIVVCVKGISEEFLLPALETALASFPFLVLNFHSDNGSEYINKIVARLLNKLLIKQTKSRSRRANDNALVETKNGSVIRKHMGYRHIPKRYAALINEFYRAYFNEYLNYHRPCGFATVAVDGRGKEKKKYDVYQTPYERFRSRPNAERYLKPGVSFAKLETIAKRMSDTEYAMMMQKQKAELFEKLSR